MQPKNQEAFQTKAKNIQNIYKHLNIDKDRQRYKRLQRSTRQKRKIAYNTYVPDMVQEDYNCKKLYSFIKSKKCDCAVIAPLRSHTQKSFTEKGVLKFQHGLNPNKATCPDEIFTRCMKEMVYMVTQSLTKIFQASIDQGQTPEDWNFIKNCDESYPVNLRPGHGVRHI